MNFLQSLIIITWFSNVYTFHSGSHFSKKSITSSTIKMKLNDFQAQRALTQRQDLIRQDSYNNLLKEIDNNEVSTIYVSGKLDTVLSEKGDGTELEDFSITNINPFVLESLTEKSTNHKVETIFLKDTSSVNTFQPLNTVFSIIDNFIIPSILISIIISFVRGVFMAQNGNSRGRGFPSFPGMPGSKNINNDKINMIKANISLNSFAGSKEIMEECTEVVSYLKNDTIYKAAGAEIPRGILLEGPPGTGKTLLAKAIASEADSNFISIAASEFVELYVGLGASKIRSLFQKARDNKPCIIFIDEIDAVGRQRGGNFAMGNDEREQTLNQLLAEMDGFADNEGILVMAATNRKDVLDSALLRPGRFDRIIVVPLPDRESRKEILRVYTQNKKFEKSINFDLVAEMTNGFSGAQIKNLLNEAAIFTSRRGEIVITEMDIMNAIDKLIVGIAKKIDERSDESKRRIAIHEIGHALISALYPEYFELQKVTIQSTYNGAGGYTLYKENMNVTDSGLYTKDLLVKRLMIGMGGKAAESIFYGDNHVSVGAIQDLKQTNSLAQRMVGNFGMGENLEAFYNENIESGRSLMTGFKYSEKTKELFDKECLKLVTHAYEKAKKILTENNGIMQIMVDKLLNNYTLYGKDIYDLLHNVVDTEIVDDVK